MKKSISLKIVAIVAMFIGFAILSAVDSLSPRTLVWAFPTALISIFVAGKIWLKVAPNEDID